MPFYELRCENSADAGSIVFAGISATFATKIRSVFCYSLVPNIQRWDDKFELGSPPIPNWFFSTLEKVASVLKSTKGRIKLGLGFDNYHLPKEAVKKLYGASRQNGATTITSHWRRNNIAAGMCYLPFTHRSVLTKYRRQLLHSGDPTRLRSPGFRRSAVARYRLY